MTFAEFQQRAISDAVQAVQNNTNFKIYFIQRVCIPGYILREWEEEVIFQVLSFTSSDKNNA